MSSYNSLSIIQQIYVWSCIIFPILRILKIFPPISVIVYYGIFVLLGGFVLLNKSIRVNWLFLLFSVICFLSVIGNNIPAYFHSYSRFFGFLLIVLCVGPLFYNDWLYNVRFYCLHVLSLLSIGISLLSFLLYLFYRPFTITERGNLFGGITSHSMIIGPIAALSVLYLIQYIQNQKIYLGKKKKVFLWISCGICFMTSILAGSRSALLALLIALIVWGWSYFSNIKKFICYILGFMFLVGSTYPLWQKYTDTIQHKMEYAYEQGSMVSSRLGKWEARIEEFKENPILGYGFGTVKLSGTTVIPKGWSGTVEPGNGWLFLLSSTGIFSFLIFSFIYCNILWRLYKIRSRLSLWFLSLLVFFGVHMMAEGYILSAGNFFFFYFWLCLGTALCYLKLDL